MPRIARVAPGGHVYHVINRANRQFRLLRTPGDFQAFYKVIEQAMERNPTRLLGWCVMGNHWHFVAWPREDGELSRFFGYLSQTHAARWQTSHNAVGTGHVYQSRFKNFMIEEEAPLAWVLRYVERNPLRAKLVRRAEDWQWSSLYARHNGPPEVRKWLSDWPIDMPRNWVEQVNRPQTQAEEEAVMQSMRRGQPLGSAAWVEKMARRYDLQSTLRPRGRQPGWRKPK